MAPTPSPDLSLKASPLPQWRLIAIIATGICVPLGAWYYFAARPPYAVLYSELRPDDAGVVVKKLKDARVPFRLEDHGATVLASVKDVDALRLDLSASGALAGNVEGLELFNGSEMGLTDFAEKIKYQRALQGELVRTIRRMDGISDARVHISVPERTLFRGEPRRAEAAVTLIARGDTTIEPTRVGGIQRLVAAAVSDLAPQDVVVLNGRGDILSVAPPSRNAATASDASGDIERVLNVLAQSFPELKPMVSIEEASVMTPSAQPAGSATAATVDATSRPVIRTRKVMIATETMLTGATMDAVRDLLERSNIFPDDGVLQIAFRQLSGASVAPLPAPSLLTPASYPAARAPTSEPQPPSALAMLVAPALAILLIAGISLWLIRRRFGRKILPGAAHAGFADQLRATLEKLEAQKEHGLS